MPSSLFYYQITLLPMLYLVPLYLSRWKLDASKVELGDVGVCKRPPVPNIGTKYRDFELRSGVFPPLLNVLGLRGSGGNARSRRGGVYLNGAGGCMVSWYKSLPNVLIEQLELRKG